jgi:MFS family permease
MSLIGSWMQTMAQGWLALELTNNAFLVGLVASVGSLPIVLFSMHAGVLADRYERLRLVKICQALLLTEATILWWVTWSGHVTIHWLLIIAAFSGTVSSVEIPSRQSLVVELAGREDLPQAIALNSSGFILARIIGPALAARVIAKLSIAWAFGLNALSYLAVLLGLFMIRLSPWRPSAQVVRPLDGIRESIAYMRGTPLVSALMKLVTVYSVLGIPYLTLMPVFARDRLGMGAGGYGLLLACVGIGGLVGALALAARSGVQAGSRTLRLSTTGYPVMLLLLSALTEPWLAYIALFFAGMAMIANGAIANSMLQHNVPDTLRGRLMAAYSFVVVGLAQTLGSFLAGAVARMLGVQWAIAAGAATMLGYAMYVFRRPPFRMPKTAGPSLT